MSQSANEQLISGLKSAAETAQQLLDETGNTKYEFYAGHLSRLHRIARTELNRDQLAQGIAEAIR